MWSEPSPPSIRRDHVSSSRADATARAGMTPKPTSASSTSWLGYLRSSQRATVAAGPSLSPWTATPFTIASPSRIGCHSWGRGVRFFFFPPYSPELNAIEPLWRQVKYQDLPERSHRAAESPQAAVDEALAKRASQFLDTQPYSETQANLRRCALGRCHPVNAGRARNPARGPEGGSAFRQIGRLGLEERIRAYDGDPLRPFHL